jgi:hypothetical protein
VRIELRNRRYLRQPTVSFHWKAASSRPLVRGRQESPESKAVACFRRGLPGTQESWLLLRENARRFRAEANGTRSVGCEGRAHRSEHTLTEESRRQGKPEASVMGVAAVLRTHSTDEGGEPQGLARVRRPRYPLEGRGEQMDGATQ